MPKKEHQLSDDSVEKSVEPKTPSAAPSAASESASPAAEKPKRRPGRPRKVVAEKDVAADAPAKAEAPAPTKPATRRATAGKTAAKSATSTEPAGKADAPAATATPAATAAAPATEKPKRRPGRPRKVVAEKDIAADASAKAEVPADQAPKAATKPGSDVVAPAAAAEPAEKPKRRRGRPRKADVEAAAASQPFSAAADEMTRRTAELTQGSATEQPTPARTVAEADAAERKPTRRTRRRVGDQAGVDVKQEPADGSVGTKGDASEKAPMATKKPVSEKPAEARDAKDDLKPSDERGESAQEGQPRRRRRNRHDDGGNAYNNGFNNGGNSRQGRGQRNNDQGQGRNNRRNNRRNGNGPDLNAEPSLSRDELQAMKVAELRAKAAELGIDGTGIRKADLVDVVYAAAAKAEGFRQARGVLEIQRGEGYGFLRSDNYMQGPNDAFVFQQTIRQYGLRPGDVLEGTVVPNKGKSKYPPLAHITSVNGRAPELARERAHFRDLTPIYPNEPLRLECGRDSITGRAIDLVAPIGKGQRGLIVSPPKAGKTTVLKHICQSIAANNPEVHLICLLVDERPEEVTDMQRSIRGEVVASTFDMPADNHTAVSELVIEHAKRLVEQGDDVVVVLDSITRLARAYNLAQPASGRILSGGVDASALYPPKKFLGAARNIENGGSLTIIASALVETGSKMDEVIFEEFKGTGNMELKLDRDLADKRIFPAIDPVASGTRNEELLIQPELQPFVWGIRRILANMNNTERAAASLVKGLRATKSNDEFLIRSAKKAQATDYTA